MPMIEDNARLDIILRFHDPSRRKELERALLSLIGQEYRPMHLHLALQRFGKAAMEELREALRPLLSIDGAPGVTLHDFRGPEPRDARSCLINLGMAAARGRYLALLDYDDVLYPEAHALLIERLRRSDACIAFGGIVVKRMRVQGRIMYAERKERPFQGRTVVDLFTGNFCPIHSFVVDRARIPDEELRFEERLTHGEDYDFLLRICAAGIADFGMIDTPIGDYLFKSDGSNTVLTDTSFSEAGRRRWLAAEAFLESRRQETVVAPAVQLAAGLPRAEPELTIAGMLAQLGRRVAA
jgi:hypothetical protein